MAEIDLGIPGLADVEEIGSGGFATVFGATQVDVGRRVAVKVLSAVDVKGRRRFDRERRTMAQTTGHGSIVTLLESGYTDPGQRPYLVMEHMAGGSLQDRLDTQGPLDVHEAIEAISAVGAGLGFAHAGGIVHKDIKPANILMGPSGAKLSDFGIASVRDSSGTSHVAYSLAYTAPETFNASRGPDGKVLDPRNEQSDLYSLAATLYALVTGEPPFTAESQATLVHQIMTEAPAPTGHGGLDRFFATALSKDPNDRYPSTFDFVEALHMVEDSASPHPLANPAATSMASPGGESSDPTTDAVGNARRVDPEPSSPTGPSIGGVTMTPTQWESVQAYAGGRPVEQIAAARGITARTVQGHLRDMCREANLPSLNDLPAWLSANGANEVDAQAGPDSAGQAGRRQEAGEGQWSSTGLETLLAADAGASHPLGPDAAHHSRREEERGRRKGRLRTRTGALATLGAIGTLALGAAFLRPLADEVRSDATPTTATTGEVGPTQSTSDIARQSTTSSPEPSSPTTTTTERTTASTQASSTTVEPRRPPSEVVVRVLNWSGGVPGLASAASETLAEAGYEVLPPGSSSLITSVYTSVIYADGYVSEAGLVTEVLGLPPVSPIAASSIAPGAPVLEEFPEADVVVVAGQDGDLLP